MMKEQIRKLFSLPRIPPYAKENFDLSYIQADRVMLVLFVIQWMAITFVTSMTYQTYLYGFIGGGLITLASFLIYREYQGTRLMRITAAIAMMLFSVIVIQQHLGRIEMHFHVFIAMAILSLYKDIVPVAVAGVTTLLHHLVFNFLQQYEISFFGMPVVVFNYGCGIDIVLLHGIFVAAELVVIAYIIKIQIEYGIELNRSEKEISGLNEELSYTSMHDTLTGLPNRQNLQAKLNLMVANANRNKTKFAVLFLDLDHFKNVNDTLGHEVGDALLKTVAKKLKTIVRTNDIVSRIGGDEFIIVLNDVRDISMLENVIIKILEAFRKEWIIQGHFLRLSVSIGAAIFPDDSRDINELMKFADIAMYKAKSEGRDQFSFFTGELNRKIHEEVEIASDMFRALEEKEFVLHYQPKIEIATGRIIGAEALIRWNHSKKGLIFPNQFIQIAENNGFILKLGTWIIGETARMIRRLNDAGYYDVHVSCNVSTRQFQDLHMYSDIESAIAENEIDSSLFAIEITESVMMQYLEVTLEVLRKIKSLGVHICMDDFGTGYSSLSYLQKFPIDSLKIDKSFVDAIVENGDNDNILINTIIAMGHTLNLNVIAEGVEYAYQKEYLRNRGCPYYQGYHFAKPVPEKEFFALLEKNHSETGSHNSF